MVVSRSRSHANLVAPQPRDGAHNAIRPDDGDRQDDRRVFTLRIRARRPRHSPTLLRQQMGTRVRPFLSDVLSD